MADIFVSYASADRDRARILAEALTRHGHDVWWDRTIPPGRVFDEVIQEALQSARCVLVLWSGQSIGSNWVKTEAAEGVAQGKLVPTLIEAVSPPIEFKRIQAADLSRWAGDESDAEFRKLLEAIDDRITHPASPMKDARSMQQTRSDAPAAPKAGHIPILGIMAILGVVGFAAAVTINKWLPRPAEQKPASSATDSVQPASTQPPAAARPAASTASPAGVATSEDKPANGPAADGRVNLLAGENGGELITASNERWAMTIDGKDDTYAWIDTGEGVFGFKGGRAATFDTFAVLIPNTSDTNLREFELLASNEPNTAFKSIGTFTTQNVRVMKNPYQEFRFAPVTAKYLKLRSLKSHGGSTAVTGYEFRLYGALK